MAKVMVYQNILEVEKKPTFEQTPSTVHQYTIQKLGPLFVNPYKARKKSMALLEFVKRFVVCVILYFRSFFYDVLIVDVTTVGLIMGGLLLLRKKPKVLILHFNVLRHRKGLWLLVSKWCFRRIEKFIVHSNYDIQYASKLYQLPLDKFIFYPYTRKHPDQGVPDSKYLSGKQEKYIVSYGVNARDYKTLFEAIAGLDIHLIVVAREHSLAGLSVPDNVSVFQNIPLEDVDRLVGGSLFTVFTFDGSEPSCGQISIVSSLMLGKPVVCTDCTAMQDYVTDGYNGMLVKIRDVEDLRNKLASLYENQVLQKRLSDGAFEWASNHTAPEAIKKKVEDVILNMTI